MVLNNNRKQQQKNVGLGFPRIIFELRKAFTISMQSTLNGKNVCSLFVVEMTYLNATHSIIPYIFA